ncbi:MAG: DUF2120 domain-containing protein [Methanobacterium sp.]|nr:DUF2120 domain-containing protein [Methanobacterium sp.]
MIKIKTHEVAGNIMHYLDAFHGSRPSMDTPQMLIVRGMSRKKIEPEELATVVSDTFDELGARRIDVFSEEAKDIIGIMDENIRDQVQIQGETDVYGIYRMKESFEAMNCYVEYSLALMDRIAIFMVLWMDKSGFGPKFVELVVANLET